MKWGEKNEMAGNWKLVSAYIRFPTTLSGLVRIRLTHLRWCAWANLNPNLALSSFT